MMEKNNFPEQTEWLRTSKYELLKRCYLVFILFQPLICTHCSFSWFGQVFTQKFAKLILVTIFFFKLSISVSGVIHPAKSIKKIVKANLLCKTKTHLVLSTAWCSQHVPDLSHLRLIISGTKHHPTLSDGEVDSAIQTSPAAKNNVLLDTLFGPNQKKPSCQWSSFMPKRFLELRHNPKGNAAPGIPKRK